MHGATDLVPGHLGEVERLGHHALAREGGVTVHEDRQHGEAIGVGGGVAERTRHALHHGVDRLEVAGVGGERERDVVAGGREVLAGGPEVVLHVAGALGARRVELALEFAEHLRVRLAHDARQHVEAPAVRHAQHHVGHARVGRFGAERVEHGNEGLGTFEAEPLLPEVLGVQEPLERLGRVEPFEDSQLLGGGDDRRHALDACLDPLLLVGLLDVHVLDADRARVRVSQDPEDLAQRQARTGREPRPERAHRELAVEVPDREVVVRDVELGVGVRFAPAERIEVRDEVAAHAVHVHEGVHLHDLLELRRRVGERAAVGVPPGGLVRHRQAREQVVEEPVGAEQEVVDAAEELAALRAGDDAVVVGVGERRDLAHARAARAWRDRRPRTRPGSRSRRRRR